MGNDHGELTGNAGQEYIGFGGQMVSGFPAGHAHVELQMVYGSLYNGPDFVKPDPFWRIPLDARKFTEIHVLVGVGGSSLFGRTARVFTVADPLSFDHVDFGAVPFVTVRTARFVTKAAVFQGKGRNLWAGGIAVVVITDPVKIAFVSDIIGNENL